MNEQKQIEKAKALPIAKNEEWAMDMRPLDIHIDELGAGIKPSFLLCISPTDDSIIGSNIFRPDAPSPEILTAAVNFMLKPAVGKPRRPKSITLSQNLGHLQTALAQLDFEVRITAKPHPAFDIVFLGLQEELTGAKEPPYTVETGADPDTVGDFFSAAADFYKAKPWKIIEGEEPVKVSLLINGKKSDYWVIIMGAAGQAFGINLYNKAEDLKALHAANLEDEIMTFAEKTWMLGFSDVRLSMAGGVANEELKAYGWQIVNDSLYPSAILLDPKNKGNMVRPNNEQLLDLTAVTRAITAFVKARKKEITAQEEVLEDTLQVEAAGEQVQAHIDFPAPEFLEEDEDDWEDLSDLPGGGLNALPPRGFPIKPSSELDRAQDMAYMAMEETSKSKRRKLAEQAIIISPDCADAYLILAEDVARTPKETEKYIRQAVEAGKRAIGDEWDELQGHFWLALETRPYMRAKHMLAELLEAQGQMDEAIEEYQDMLRLNPGDNQGVRYVLASTLLLADRYDDLKKLLTEYEDDGSAFLLYPQALLSFRQSGTSAKANRDLKKAVAANTYVVDYLTGRTPMPKYAPDMYSLGGKDEAVLVADQILGLWKDTEGAIDWLNKQTAK